MYKLESSTLEFRVRLHPDVKLHPNPQDVRNYGGSAAAVVGGAVVRAVPVQPRGFRIFTADGLSLCLVDDINEVGTQEGT